MTCPRCGDVMFWAETSCPHPDEPGDTLRVAVCGNCDYGINEHTERVCACEPVATT